MDVGIIERNPQVAPARMGAFAHPRVAGREADVDLRVAAEQLEEIRQHHLDLYAKRDVITQTTTAAGLPEEPPGQNPDPPPHR